MNDIYDAKSFTLTLIYAFFYVVTLGHCFYAVLINCDYMEFKNEINLQMQALINFFAMLIFTLIDDQRK